MARISGVNIPTAKKIHIALTYIYGVGPKIANDLSDQASIDKSKRVNELNDEELNKIREIRNFIIGKNLNVDIEVDGGIKANWTISQCADAGANCFIAGSGMFAYPTLKEGCDDLRKVAQEALNGKVLSEPQ